MLALLFGLLVMAPVAPDTALPRPGARNPAFARDGRFAVELGGDLWMVDTTGRRWLQITSGPAWEGEPAWATDSSALVFASDRAGGFDLWRVRVGPEGATGTPERWVGTPDPEREPSVAPDGSVVFVRGRGPTANLWVRTPDRSERQLTRAAGAERWPAVSPDGRRVAYVAEREGRRELRLLLLAGGTDTVVVRDLQPERPVWSPGGDRLAFATRAPRPGVWITPVDGRYLNLVSERRAAPAWAPDGRLLLADLPREEPGYNGDPERPATRASAEGLSPGGRLWFLQPSAVPDAMLAEVPIDAPLARQERNTQALDELWERVAGRFRGAASGGAKLHAWTAVRERHRSRVLAARNQEELEDALHAMLRERPPFGDEARGRAAVASAHPLATEAGLEALRRGGNVVDAAVAVSFALGVVEPDASGIGGYGSMVLFLRGMREPTAIEFLTRVPQAAALENTGQFASGGRLPPHGPVLVNVPGTVAGIWLAWKRYGSGQVPWAALLAPAIRLAERGWVLDDAFATTLRREREAFTRYPGSRALFFPRGEPLAAGDTLRNPDLAWTLREIARGGADAFYRGEVARRLVADLRAGGSPITLQDLARYYAVERTPVQSGYRGYTIYGSPPATTGGALLAGQLNLLEQSRAPRPFADDGAALHAMIEAWKLAPPTRGRIADPGLWPINLTAFTSDDTARVRWRCFDPARASPAPSETDGALPCAAAGRDSLSGRPTEGCPNGVPADTKQGCRMTGTTAFAVADAQGNLVSVTQTLGTWGGNFHLSPGLGFLYNDKLGSYGSDPTAYNARIPFARNVTSISPTLVFRGSGAGQRPLLAIGAAGNAWITSAVFQTTVGILDGGLDPQRALELPRFLVGSERQPAGRRQSVVQIEGGYAPAALRHLRALGHELQVISEPGELRMGYGAAVLVGNGSVRAGADPRRSGTAGAIP